jgi:YggT family protein
MTTVASSFSGLMCTALWVFEVILLVRVVLSWIQLAGVRMPTTGPARSAYDLLFDVTEPVLKPLRRIIPPAGMFDLSVLVAFVIIVVLQRVFC